MTINNQNILKLGIAVSLISLTLLLFFGKASPDRTWLVKEIWEAGHFVLFATATLALLNIPQLTKQNIRNKSLITAVFAFCAGLGTEALQFLIGRSFELKDLFNDAIGAFAGLTLTLLFAKTTVQKKLYLALALVLLSIIGLRGVLVASYDLVNRNIQFPLLNGFESDLEVSHWHTIAASIEKDSRFSSQGKSSLKVTFVNASYPTISLDVFNRDWRGFENLVFDLHSKREVETQLVLKVFDIHHPGRGYHFNDRFNHSFKVKPGINQIKIPLSLIESSPLNRKMDMSKITSISLFSVEPEDPFEFHLDNLRLSN